MLNSKNQHSRSYKINVFCVAGWKVHTSLKSVRKELSYSPLQRCSILCSISWCRMLVTASELTRSNSCSVELKLTKKTFMKTLYKLAIYLSNKVTLGFMKGNNTACSIFEVYITQYANILHEWNNEKIPNAQLDLLQLVWWMSLNYYQHLLTNLIRLS